MDQKSQKLQIVVITPTHNRVDYLPEAINSVRANVVAPIDCTYEHYICENGCTDGTKEYLDEAIKQEGAPVKYWSVPDKLLPGPARNTIIKHVPNDAFIFPLDDDDVVLQRSIYHWADLIERHPGQQWFVTDFLRMDQERRYLLKEDYYAWKFDSPVAMLGAIFRGETFIQGNVCYSKKLFDEVGAYHEKIRMAEDLDLYVRFLIAGHLPVVGSHISHLHRFHTGNISIGVDHKKHNEDLKSIYDRYAEQLQKLGVERPRD